MLWLNLGFSFTNFFGLKKRDFMEGRHRPHVLYVPPSAYVKTLIKSLDHGEFQLVVELSEILQGSRWHCLTTGAFGSVFLKKIKSIIVIPSRSARATNSSARVSDRSSHSFVFIAHPLLWFCRKPLVGSQSLDRIVHIFFHVNNVRSSSNLTSQAASSRGSDCSSQQYQTWASTLHLGQ